MHKLSRAILYNLYFLFLYFTFRFLTLCKYNYMEATDHLRFPRRLQGCPSPRFTGSHYLMFQYQIVNVNAQMIRMVHTMLWCRVEPLHLIRNPSIKYAFVLGGMKLQSFELRMCVTFYIIQRTSEIMHNLCLNYRNYLGKFFSQLLKYFRTPSLAIIPNCDTTYLPIAIFQVYQSLFVDSKVSR